VIGVNDRPNSRKIKKFPVIFPVLRESGTSRDAGPVSAGRLIGFDIRKPRD
jgi:hypothetical protein